MLVISGWRLDPYLNILRKLFGHNYQVWTFSIFSVYRDSVHIVILVLFDLSKLQSMIQMKRCSVYAAGYLILHIQEHYWAWLRVTQWVFNKKELLTLSEHLGSPSILYGIRFAQHLCCSPLIFGPVRDAHRFSFLCCFCLFCLSSSCVLSTQCWQCLWIVHSSLPLLFI